MTYSSVSYTTNDNNNNNSNNTTGGGLRIIPVTVITGFLGSGKSTLLNYILNDETHKLRFAIIENEVGDISIDHKLITKSVDTDGTSSTMIEVTNGCICCRIRGDLVKTLKKLYKKMSRRKFDGVLIETTGLADPGPIIQTFFMDPVVQSMFRLDGVVTVVDSRHILERMNEKREPNVTNEALEQVAFADVILLNKIDLIENNNDEKKKKKKNIVVVDDIIDEIETINPTVNIIKTVHSQVDNVREVLLNIGGFDIQRALEMDPFFLKNERKHRKDMTISSVTCQMNGEVNLQLLNQWIRHLLMKENNIDNNEMNDNNLLESSSSAAPKIEEKIDDEHHNNNDTNAHNHHHHHHPNNNNNNTKTSVLYRYKGVIAVKGMKNKYVFQGVGMMFSGGFLPNNEWNDDDDEERISQFVFIGRNLDHDKLKRGFYACKVSNELRFKIGDKVMANIGYWKNGYIEAIWDECNAYRIKLEGDDDDVDEGSVWAPIDVDDYVRAREKN